MVARKLGWFEVWLGKHWDSSSKATNSMFLATYIFVSQQYVWIDDGTNYTIPAQRRTVGFDF
jgi:hypothetical protein